jgi:hypothetical protein
LTASTTAAPLTHPAGFPKRAIVTIANNRCNTVFHGGKGVTSGSGKSLASGSSTSYGNHSTDDPAYIVTASGTAVVQVTFTYPVW